MISVYGKHPSFGDFISHGVSPHFQEAIIPWIGKIMQETRDYLGHGWDTIYDTALPLRFWIGSDVFDQSSMRGVLYCSHDKVGRRYPLIIIEQAQGLPMPLIAVKQGFYETLEARLIAVASNTIGSADEIITDIGINCDLAEKVATDNEQTSFWAVNPDPEVNHLLEAVGATDQQHAAAGRSYWWTAGRNARASTFLAAQGIPNAAEMAWLLSGVAADGLQQFEPEKKPDIESLKMGNLSDD